MANKIGWNYGFINAFGDIPIPSMIIVPHLVMV